MGITLILTEDQGFFILVMEDLKLRHFSMERAVTIMSAWACSGTTRFPAGSWEASSFANAHCGVFPRLQSAGVVPRPVRIRQIFGKGV